MAAMPTAAPHTRTAPAPRLWPLVWPLFLELALGIGIGVLGTVLAARQGDASAAAFAVVHHVLGMLFILFRVVGAGISAVLSQALGGGRQELAASVARAALGASTWLGAACALLAGLGASAWLQLVRTPPEVQAVAQPFLQALAVAMLLDAWNASMAAVLRSHLRSRQALLVVVAMHGTHAALALWLMPRLGLPGFALALLASRMLGAVLHLVFWRRHLGLRLRLHDFWRLPRAELAAMLHIGLPGAAENVAYRLSFIASIAVVGTMGAMALATHAYATQLSYAALLFGLALGFSVEILVAHHVGAARLQAARELVKRTLWRSLVVSVVATTGCAHTLACFHARRPDHRPGHHPAVVDGAAGARAHFQPDRHQRPARRRRCALPRGLWCVFDGLGARRWQLAARPAPRPGPRGRVDRLRRRRVGARPGDVVALATPGVGAPCARSAVAGAAGRAWELIRFTRRGGGSAVSLNAPAAPHPPPSTRGAPNSAA
jgi:Na+-driven multidrug efflux pump